jgi:hypothetical protein
MKEAEILHIAFENLKTLTKTGISVDHLDFFDDRHWDGRLNVVTGETKNEFKVEVKGNVLPSNLAQWAVKLKAPDTLLVAKYISNPAKALLEQQNINYLDIAGNCHIRSGKGIFWFIKGQVAAKDLNENKHRAFNKNGIKLIYSLLLNEKLLNEPYRAMAEVACIAISTVGDILKDLQESKFLVRLNDQQSALVNKPELLGQWVTAFHQKLKPKLLKGRYSLGNENWKQLDLESHAFWGGEPAAGLLTNHLRPGAWSLYTDLDRRSLLKDLQLLPNPKGNVEVYTPFWNTKNTIFIAHELKTVHPLLVYAELIGTGNDRNIETSKKIYEQYLKDIIE